MAGKIFKTGIRFNDVLFKYVSFIFDQNTINAHVEAFFTNPAMGRMKFIGNIPADAWEMILVDENWEPITNSVSKTTKAAAKKAIKESK